VSELQELRADLERPGATAGPQHLLRLLLLVERIHDVAHRFAALVDAGRDAVADLTGRLAPLEERLLLLDELPANAPLGALIRVRGDLTGSLYLGNGPTRPLTKLTPTLLNGNPI
jgi:hypothetical protein